jgi:hypothetical protein
MITVGFRHTTGRTLFSRLVRLVAGRPVHCAVFTVRTRDGWLGIESTAGPGVQRRVWSDAELARDGWTTHAVAGVDAADVARFADARVGLKYDYVGALLYGTPLTTRNRWTCSELCAEALVAAGAPLAWFDAGRTPRRLCHVITAREG